MALHTLTDRNYVTVNNRVLSPEFRGRMVSAFLSHHFSEVTDYSFTADIETELDNVSAGITKWKGLLGDYWMRFKSNCDHASDIPIYQKNGLLIAFIIYCLICLSDILLITSYLTCFSCTEGTLIFKVTRFGSGYFIGCDQHPRCKFHILYGDEEKEDTPQPNITIGEEPKLLGFNSSNEKVLLKRGSYAIYVQLGEDRKGHTPKRTTVPYVKDLESTTLEDALALLQYPFTLAKHPEDGRPVIIKAAKDGYSIRHRSTIAHVPKVLL
ncbi:putative DNA topoisomerase [Medicago truncatula]|uniref:Putative DNA topoisomerase n=1 Tax=Medicago truncatula TaxID=3880 RepID=A0A396JKH0_MEDTR|nr:putative DNA topoisomerase [Medicago truncatula]